MPHVFRHGKHTPRPGCQSVRTNSGAQPPAQRSGSPWSKRAEQPNVLQPPANGDAQHTRAGRTGPIPLLSVNTGSCKPSVIAVAVFCAIVLEDDPRLFFQTPPSHPQNHSLAPAAAVEVRGLHHVNLRHLHSVRVVHLEARRRARVRNRAAVAAHSGSIYQSRWLEQGVGCDERGREPECYCQHVHGRSAWVCGSDVH